MSCIFRSILILDIVAIFFLIFGKLFYVNK